jgi:hypothetical protein
MKAFRPHSRLAAVERSAYRISRVLINASQAAVSRLYCVKAHWHIGLMSDLVLCDAVQCGDHTLRHIEKHIVAIAGHDYFRELLHITHSIGFE